LNLIKNPYFLGFLGVYALAVGALVATGTYSIAEPLFMLAIFGIILPGVAWFMCRKRAPLPTRVNFTAGELLTVAGCVVFVSVFLVWGGQWTDALVYRFVEETPRFDYLLDIAKKLAVFVLVPYWLLSRLFGYSWKDFGFGARLKTVFAPPYLALMGVFFLLYLLIQGMMGQAAQPLFRGEFPLSSLALGSLLLYPLLVLEVGIVEEFFFRAVVQARIAAWLKSEVAGLFLMALVFGLAHAPGIYLRGAAASTCAARAR